MAATSTHIRRAKPGDLDALIALEHDSFNNDYVSRAQFRRHIASASAVVLVADPGGTVAGCALLFFRRNAPAARLYSIAVASTARGLGTGAALLASAEGEARSRRCVAMRLEVHTGNRAAIALYERCGYARRDRIRGFYEDGADAWRYEKALD